MPPRAAFFVGWSFMLHCYKLGGRNIVLDTFSGGVHVVDDVAFEMIRNFESFSKEALVEHCLALFSSLPVSKEELDECYEEILSLKNDGKLFSPDTFSSKATALKEKTSGVVKALCLHIAHTCNLNCSYCFASQGKYSGERAMMSFEVGKRALDFLVENSKGRRNLEVDFFGGEPLMNFGVVKD